MKDDSLPCPACNGHGRVSEASGATVQDLCAADRLERFRESVMAILSPDGELVPGWFWHATWYFWNRGASPEACAANILREEKGKKEETWRDRRPML